MKTFYHKCTKNLSTLLFTHTPGALTCADYRQPLSLHLNLGNQPLKGVVKSFSNPTESWNEINKMFKTF